ncbi:MAG TPA: AAA family ATPase [Alphaproteobacteria bacterium]|nr:AAA family ATPase [Alphaproteobacteria bacterium]
MAEQSGTKSGSPAPLPAALPVEVLRRVCDPATIPFATTREAEPLTTVIGQDRAVAAVEFGIGIRREGYNLFALGPPGTGKHTLIHDYLTRAAAEEPTPPDYVYVNNFDDPHKPHALKLPAGRAMALHDALEALVRELRTALPGVFESDEYVSRRQMFEGEFKRRQEEMFEGLQARAKEKGIALMRTPVGLMFAPVRDGEVIEPKEFEKLPEEEQERLKHDIEALQEDLRKSMEQLPAWSKELRDKLRELNREVTQFAVGHLIQAVREAFADAPAVVEYLDRVEADIVDNAFDFIRSVMAQDSGVGSAGGGGGAPGTRPHDAPDDETLFRRYRVNVLVDNREVKGAPVIYEDHPVLGNLIGRIEHTAQFGALVTDFNLIKPGALHRANGGYLIIDARRILMQPLAWEELKRTLRSGEIRIESVGQLLSVISTVSLDPEPIALDIKIVLVGDRQLYQLLCALDPDFDGLFKVQAEFQHVMTRTDESVGDYARLIATLAERHELRAFDRTAVARIVEYGQRLADDNERLSTSFRDILDILRETDYWAGKNGNGTASAADVQRAIDTKIHRADWVRELIHEQITRGTVLIDVDGEAVGQVNALSVLQLGNFSFGKPSRITARVRLGKGEVVDIERQVELGGALHSKGVLILSSFLGARYCAERPLALSASLVFEQSYGGVDGDSASSTELYALLSALSGLPIDQSFAITGSVNQHGEVQAIGGVNQKIEGYFDICSALGLTGRQGVLIPATNTKHLMLRHDVVEACDAGRFAVYPIATIDRGIALLTGVQAGQRGADGAFPEGSVNARVEARLEDFAEKARAFAKGRPDAGDEEEGT